uniref:Cytochrome c oxidase subunit 3 n=1 Tax=Eleutherocaulis alte TaxID=74076 RepID=A0A1P7YWB2_9EUPU|nr:cytochrome c oxidase subunit III [Eleutherocaulis alte]AKM99604.1 cytochrome c oxidase subunit III [Eleutherocaulis alte]WDD39309.1 cytochrome c oxidase subunit 3 [Eleutherocaulis alte]
MTTPFHLVEKSPWPILASFSVLAIPVGTISMIREKNMSILIIGITVTTIIAYLWWRDIIRESTMQGFHNSLVTTGLKYGMFLFIVSEVFFFLSFFWAFFHSSLAPTPEIGSIWPPYNISTLEVFQVPLLNTSVLLLSGVSITWAHHSLDEKNKKEATLSLLLTVLLGFYFLNLQLGEYKETSFSIADSIYGSTFFVATGFHGLHVMIGTAFLSVCFLRLISNHFSNTHYIGFLTAAWYWHFVDVVWLFLYISIYWWGS